MLVKEDYAMEILTLGEKIKRRRKELEMTLKDLAGDRITPGQISLVESGRSNPSMDLLEYLANALQTSVEYLMESEETQAEKICVYYEQMAETYILNQDYISAEKYIENALYYAEKYDLEYRKAKNLFLSGTIQYFAFMLASFLTNQPTFSKVMMPSILCKPRIISISSLSLLILRYNSKTTSFFLELFLRLKCVPSRHFQSNTQ